MGWANAAIEVAITALQTHNKPLERLNILNLLFEQKKKLSNHTN